MEVVVVVLKQIKGGEGTIGKLLREPELYDNLNSFLKSLAQLTSKLDEVAGDLGEFAEAVGEQKGVLGKLIFSEDYDRDFSRAVSSTAEIVVALEGALDSSSDQGSVLKRLLLDGQLEWNTRLALSPAAGQRCFTVEDRLRATELLGQLHMGIARCVGLDLNPGRLDIIIDALLTAALLLDFKTEIHALDHEIEFAVLHRLREAPQRIGKVDKAGNGRGTAPFPDPFPGVH